jgi:hypothetical protein
VISNFDDLGCDDVTFVPNKEPKLGVPYAAKAGGFPGISFQDSHGKKCKIQMSSLCEGYPPGMSALWIGCGKDEMHLTREQVAFLALELGSWVADGIFMHQREEAN